ncbi:MAG: MotA/TolQ/ExbB proton channel family protein [Schleiferiaceae bacterium]|jgi:biopolymer transport protein ExbB|nr:MotA/TolQ/ExbB proton channel family protein [Flavobacteriales bacterium]MDG1006490.1 MotA/TolQ/ExbB proton channel family protein [Schleiferiaceae bacterium]NCF58190.1 MotA/TolQ/ExbB proton channel family protein [Bacteroidota bacterium]NCG44010.1 MotA/TolQ/ExbB proton channel family protein [Pseudomonadota bacterium]MBT3571857.1 MotA/TolQ/ExbB proton channel family protein [Flavobacteriales bacterium]
MQLLQIDVPTEALEPEVTESTLSILSLMTNGGIGAQIIMSILFIMSIMAIYLFVSRLSAIKRSSQMDSKFMDDIKDYITNGNLQSATNLCERSDTPVGRMLAKGIRRIGKPLQDISASIENQGKLEIQRLERNLPYLATISGGAPMLGFLGTVIGMILSFKEMANAGGGVQVDMMAEGIYVAMTTTVAGLVVGIIAYFGYNYLVMRVESVIHTMESSATEFLDLLHEPV